VLAAAAIVVVGWGAVQAILMLRTVTWPDLRLLLEGAGATFLRVNAALAISALWTIPVGVAIGLNPSSARIVQPVAQVMASVPATAFFPILLIGLVQDRGGLASVPLPSCCWELSGIILFNVIAGAMSIPSDLREVSSLYHFNRCNAGQAYSARNFPYLITGMVTASGGAWNASVFAEYSHVADRTLETIGLGAQIDAAPTAPLSHPALATILSRSMVVTHDPPGLAASTASPRLGINSKAKSLSVTGNAGFQPLAGGIPAQMRYRQRLEPALPVTERLLAFEFIPSLGEAVEAPQTRRFMVTTMSEIRMVARSRMGKRPLSVAASICAPRPMVSSVRSATCEYSAKNRSVPAPPDAVTMPVMR